MSNQAMRARAEPVPATLRIVPGPILSAVVGTFAALLGPSHVLMSSLWSEELRSGHVASVPPQFEWLLRRDRTPRLSELPFDTITLVRMLDGQRREYGVSFHSDGSARLASYRGLDLQGRFIGHVESVEFGRLCQLVERSGFAEMDPQYWQPVKVKGISPDEAETWGVYVTATSGKWTKTVFDGEGSGPVELWGIERTIEDMRADVEWVPE